MGASHTRNEIHNVYRLIKSHRHLWKILCLLLSLHSPVPHDLLLKLMKIYQILDLATPASLRPYFHDLFHPAFWCHHPAFLPGSSPICQWNIWIWGV
jgi:hypothetical protein